MISKEALQALRERFPKGTRIELVIVLVKSFYTDKIPIPLK